MEPRDKLPVTETWRLRAVAAFDALPHGAKQQCADFAGCSPAMVTRILTPGETDASEFVGPMSEFLKIPPPMVRVETQLQVDLHEAARVLGPDDVRLLIENAKRLNR